MLKQIYVYITRIKRSNVCKYPFALLNRQRDLSSSILLQTQFYLFFHFSVTPLSQLEQESIDSSRSKRKKEKKKERLLLPLVVYEPLLAPSQPVPHQTVGYLEAEHLLFVDVNDQGQGIPDLHVFRHLMPRRIPAEDLHRAPRHGSRRLS